MKVCLVTGCAGFIGYHTSKRLLDLGYVVLGYDDINDYYSPALKQARISSLQENELFHFKRDCITNFQSLQSFIKPYKDQLIYIVHLAAQAGVRYSVDNPFAYGKSNLTGHLSLLEIARWLPNLEHMVYASSSSVYGANEKLPFSVDDVTDTPMSLYAATKKSGEMLSYSYSHLYKLKLTGLRFFTVYGPWGRPDMAAYIFTKAILAGKPIQVYNYGKMRRNFTYIDDVVDGITRCLFMPTDINASDSRVYNIGNQRSEKLLDFIKVIEGCLGKKADVQLKPLQLGDVPDTIADITTSTQDFGFVPKTNIDIGLQKFVTWICNYQELVDVS